MANVGGTRILGDRRYSRDHIVEEFVPPSGWTEDSNGHYLLLQLPGFKKEEVRLEIASTGNIILSGERMVNESKAAFIEQNYKLPEDSDTDKITGKFDGMLLYITVPKLARKEESEAKREDVQNVNSVMPENAQEEQKYTENLGIPDDGGSEHRQHHANQTVGGRYGSKKSNRVDSFTNEFLKSLEVGPMGRAMELLKRNKGIALALAVAFSFGVYVSRLGSN